MKLISKLAILLIAVSFFAACKNNQNKGVEVEAKQAEEVVKEVAKSAAAYSVDTETTSILWTGTKPTGSHNGTIKVSNGSLAVNDGQLIAGDFTIDMTSISNADLAAGEGKEKLEGHLKTGDFFEVEKFPTGEFVITEVKAVGNQEGITHEITGNLTMKDVSKSITFPANIVIAGDMLTATTPAFNINRTEWGINFKSGIIGTAKDKLIHDDITLVVNLAAKK